jgi:hypothetical protein
MPTLGRRASIEQFLRTYKDKTQIGKYSDLILLNVDNDPALHSYDDITTQIIRHIEPNTGGYAQGCNKLWELHPEYSYYVSMEDDCLLLDDDWDKKLIEFSRTRFPDGLGIVLMHDVSGEVICSCISKWWADTLGHLYFPPLREHGVKSTYNLGISLKRLEISYNTRIKHIQTGRDGFSNGKVEWMSPEAQIRYRENDERYKLWETQEFPIQKSLLEAAIENFTRDDCLQSQEADRNFA